MTFNFFRFSDEYFCHHVYEKLKLIDDQIKKDIITHKKLLENWAHFFSLYINSKHDITENDLPPNFSASQVLPFLVIVTDGDAGSGKTFAANCLMQKSNIFSTSSFSRKATQASVNYSEDEYLSGGQVQEDTLFQMFRIHFSRAKMRILIKSLNKDEELKAVYHKMATSNLLEHELENFSRRMFVKILRKLRHLIWEIFNDLIYEFTRRSDRRRTIVNPNHPHYCKDIAIHVGEYNILQNYDETLRKTQKNTQFKSRFPGLTDKQIKMRIQNNESTLTQEAYVNFINMTTYSNTIATCVLYRGIIYEEDGELPAFYDDLRKIITWLCLLIYLPPFIYESVPILISSGSLRQSKAIGFEYSALDINISPYRIKDVIFFKSEMYRRDPTMSIHHYAQRLTRLTLERCLPINNLTMASMYNNEISGKNAENPQFLPNALRIYQKHKDVSAFYKRVQKDGCATVPVIDMVYVSDLLRELGDHQTLGDQWMTDLSTLTEREAQKQRQCMWKQKSNLYVDQDKYSDLDCNKFFFEAGTHDFKDFQEGVETIIVEHIKRCQSKLLKRKYEDEETYIDVNTGLHLIDETNLDEEAFDTIKYDEFINDVHKKTKQIEDENSKQYQCHITGPATEGLSKREHMKKRQFIPTYLEILGDGRRIADSCLQGSKVVDEYARFTYVPKADLFVEYGTFNRTGQINVNARLLYMGFIRQRFLKEGSPVTVEHRDTLFQLVGMSGTVRKLLTSAVFQTFSTGSFKIMIYDMILDELFTILINDDSISDEAIFVMLQNMMEEKEVGRQKMKDKFREKYQDSTNTVTTTDATMQYECVLDRIITRLCQLKTDKIVKLIEDCHLDIYIEHSVLWGYFKYHIKRQTIPNLETYCTKVPLTVFNAAKRFQLYSTSHKSMSWNEYCNKEKWNKYNSTSRFITNGIKYHFPNMFSKLDSFVLMDNVLVWKTCPQFTAPVRWTDIFLPSSDGYKSKYGEQSKKKLYFIHRKINKPQLRKESNTYNLFQLNFGDLVNLPEKFYSNYINTPSNIVATGKQEEFYYSRQNTINPGLCHKKKKQNSHFDSIESVLFYTCFQSIFSTSAATIHSIQGSTCKGQLIIDLVKQKLNTVLVSISRCTDLSKLYVANANQSQYFTENFESAEKRKINHQRQKELTAYTFFR